MAAAPAADAAGPKPKGKKPIIFGAVAVLLLAVAAAAWMLLGRGGEEDEEAAAAPAAAQHARPKAGTPPTYLPMENMVVNLADAGGEKFAQVGVTLEVADAKVSDQIKAHMPTIRSAVLLLVSQRTSEELLTREGKEKLARDILREVSHPLGYEVEDDAPDDGKSRRRARAAFNPVYNVLFSSFIIQ